MGSRRDRGVAALTSAVLGLAWAGPAAAQVPPGPAVQVPSTQRSQVVPTRPQLEVPAPPEAPARPRVNVRRVLQPGPCPLDEAVRVTLSSVRFEDARGGALAPQLARLLAPVTVPQPGEQAIASVCAIRDRANQALYAAGYIASVQIPPQEIAGGVLRLSLVSARIVQVRVEGVAEKLPGQLARRIDRIRGLDPLNEHDLEHELLLANDVPGLALQLTLQPAGRDPGDVVAVVTVDQKPAQLLANFQNTGSPQLGPGLFALRGAVYNLTGHADETYLGYSNSADWNEVHVVQAGESIGLGTGGARIGVRASYGLSNPTITNLELHSRSLIAGLDLSAPLYRALTRSGSTADDWNVYVGAGFELLNQRTVISATGTQVPFTRDRLRVFYGRMGLRLTSRDSENQPVSDIDAVVEMRRGVGILNATRLGVTQDNFQPSRFAGDPQALEVRGTLNASFWPFAGFRRLAFDLSVYGQWANRPLLNLEEFTIGNLTYGRGYDPGANAGDQAVAVHLSPRLRVFDRPYARVEITGFYDAVRFWNLDPGTLETNRILRSAGGGIRVSMPQQVALDVTYARPFDHVLVTDTRAPRDRVLVTLTTQLFPWRFGR